MHFLVGKQIQIRLLISISIAFCSMICEIEQKGMTLDHDFVYSFPLFCSFLRKEGRREGEWLAKIVIKSHAFLLDRFVKIYLSIYPSINLFISICLSIWITLYWLLSVEGLAEGWKDRGNKLIKSIICNQSINQFIDWLISVIIQY